MVAVHLLRRAERDVHAHEHARRQSLGIDGVRQGDVARLQVGAEQDAVHLLAVQRVRRQVLGGVADRRHDLRLERRRPGVRALLAGHAVEDRAARRLMRRALLLLLLLDRLRDLRLLVLVTLLPLGHGGPPLDLPCRPWCTRSGRPTSGWLDRDQEMDYSVARA